MPVRKSDLYSSLWKSCDELRGGMDASQYKDYVLVLLFVKYVSDRYAGQPNALIEVPDDASFDYMVTLKGKANIGEEINKLIGRLANANDLNGVITIADFDDAGKLGQGKEMQDRLSNLIGIFQNPNLDFSRNRAEGDDLLGDAYEYLMRHFATESGKSKGQFYTPAEVSRIIAKVIGSSKARRQSQTIYDPTCGSGSLLLKAADEAPQGVSIYGQEMDVATTALARMNMILHDNPTAEIAPGGSSTLSNPFFKDPTGGLKTFDFAVANPPFSYKAWRSGVQLTDDEHHRFALGIPPARNGDYAFLLHLLASLKSTGKGAIILPHGVLFRGNAEGEIRKNIIRKGYIKGIIGLPANLFYGTGIPACIIVLDKENAHARTGIFMIDASKGFRKDGNKNRLRAQDIHRIVDVFNKQLEVPKYSRLVPTAEIADPANDYNLNLPRYIDSSEPEDTHDLEAHLRGGIPNQDLDSLSAYWDVCPSLRQELFQSGNRPGYSTAKVESGQVRSTILSHPEFGAYLASVGAVSAEWQQTHTPLLRSLQQESKPKDIISTLSEDLLQRFSDLPLLDRYDLYQQLMDYWDEVMQDDLYLIVAEGWKAAAQPLALAQEGGGSKETADLVIKRRKYKMDLIPPGLIINRYFSKEQAALEALQAKQEAAASELDEFVDEHTGDEGSLEEVANDKGKVIRTAVKPRLTAIKNEPDSEEEQAVLSRCLELLVAESVAGEAVKEAQEELALAVLAKYPILSDTEIRALVVEDKWLTSIHAAIEGEVQRVTQRLASRIRELAERYGTPLPELEREVAGLSTKVEGHLKQMGLVWQ